MPAVVSVRVILPKQKVVAINILGGLGGTFGGLTFPHFFLAGPASGSAKGIASFRLPVPDDIPFAPVLNAPNVFQQVNTIPGIRVGTNYVTSDYNVDVIDFEILADATAGPINITLPAALGTGQVVRVKKVDSTANVVAVLAQSGDLIDGSISVNLTEQYADCTLYDGALEYWDNSGSVASGGGADFGVNGRVVDLFPIKGFAFQVFNGVSWIEQVRYTEPSSSPPPTSEISYFLRPEITDKIALAAWPTVGILQNSVMQCRFAGAFVTFFFDPGAADGGDPGQVAPDDYDPVTNNFHWTQGS